MTTETIKKDTAFLYIITSLEVAIKAIPQNKVPENTPALDLAESVLESTIKTFEEQLSHEAKMALAMARKVR